MKSKAYRAIAVNHLQLDRLLQQRHQALVRAGLDVGKDHLLSVLLWTGHDFERPWRCHNPADLACAEDALLREILRRDCSVDEQFKLGQTATKGAKSGDTFFRRKK